MNRSRLQRPLPYRGAAIALCITTLVACGDEGRDPVTIPNVFDLAHDPTEGISEVPENPGVVMTADALRNALERDLALHGVTLVQAMRAIESGSPSADGWIAELARNTDDIVSKVGAIYGPTGAFAFYQQWAQHTQFLADYAQAVRDGDDTAREAARTHLASYTADSGKFFERATGGQLPADAVTDLLDEHVGHMQAMIDAVAADDDASALAAAQTDNAYLAGIARGLSGAFVAQHPEWFPGDIDGPVPVYCSLVTVSTGDYLLRQFFAETPVTTDDEAFFTAVGAPLTEVLGPLEGIASPDPVIQANAARQALDNAIAVGRAGAETP
jgi:hypothetical protein